MQQNIRNQWIHHQSVKCSSKAHPANYKCWMIERLQKYKQNVKQGKTYTITYVSNRIQEEI